MPNIINLKNKIEKPKKQEKVEEIAEQVKKKEDVIEKALERIAEKNQEKETTEVEEQASGPEVATGLAAGISIQQKRKERKKQVETILTKDMEDIYLSMTPKKQKEFKEAGEEAAEEINSLLEKTKVKIKKIIDAIKKWLTVIPGVNKYFLEQESKIKADEIFKLK